MYKIKSTSQPIRFDNLKELAAGGEGRILEHPTDSKLVLKIYHQIRPASFASHLESLQKLPSDTWVAPKDIIIDDKGSVAGFIMPYVNFNDYTLFNNLFNKGYCTNNNITETLKIQILNDLKSNLDYLHTENINVGDLNQYNLYFSKKGEILFVDVDSFQTKSQKHSGVLLDDIRDWTSVIDINNLTDSWSFDILAFWSLTYVHPYKWVAPGNKDSLEIRVKQNKSILSTIPNIRIPAIYACPTGSVLAQFKEIFNGRRYMVALTGAVKPVVGAIVKLPTHSQSVTIRELYTGVYDVMANHERISFRDSNGQWNLIDTSLKGFTRKLEESNLVIYPGTKFNLYGESNSIKNKGNFYAHFSMPKFYYSYGSLSILDYINDIQFNISIDEQIGDSVRHTITPMYAKSILYGESPLQNFGGIKKLNVPNGHTYRMVDIPKTTKDAVWCNGYVGFEYIHRNKVEYMIENVDGNGTQLSFDYLPRFSAMGKMLFVPKDGEIDVYADMTLATTLDVPNCTRDSRLYVTNSGILLLENNTLYLLNTK
jgi:serine/threonine protein kinase